MQPLHCLKSAVTDVITRLHCEPQHVAPVESEADFMSQPFDWEHQWYPVAVVTDLDPSRCVQGVTQTSIVAKLSGPLCTGGHPSDYASSNAFRCQCLPA